MLASRPRAQSRSAPAAPERSRTLGSSGAMSGPPILSIRQALASHQLARDHDFHDLGGAVADLEADDVAQPLLERQLLSITVMTVQQQALVDRLHGELRHP